MPMHHCTHSGDRSLHFDYFGQALERCSDCGELWVLAPAAHDEAAAYYLHRKKPPHAHR